MARASVPKVRSTSRVSKRLASTPGQPGFTFGRQVFARMPKAVFRKQSIRTLIKNNPSDGMTQREYGNLTATNGVVTGDRGGYKGARVVRQTPVAPPRSNANVKVITPPSTTNRGGIRSPFRKGRGTNP